MSRALRFFDIIKDVGEDILTSLGSSAKEEDIRTREYLELISQIYELLSKAHDNILNAIMDLSLASNKEEVDSSINALSTMGIKDALKSQELCNQLREAGNDIRRKLLTYEKLDEAQISYLKQLSEGLERAEWGTAFLYEDIYRELSDIVDSETSIESIKYVAENILSNMVDQKGKFDYLQKKAQSMLKRIV